MLVLDFSCCVTDYLKFSSFTQHPFISISVGRSKSGNGMTELSENKVLAGLYCQKVVFLFESHMIGLEFMSCDCRPKD